MNFTKKFLLYGANGYTGALIARYAKHYYLEPVLAGRNQEKLKILASSLGLEYIVVDINNQKELQNSLKDFKLVVHAAGPFKDTAKQMIEACLHTATHYIDINGDIAVFEMLKSYDNSAKEANIMLMPGVGFDVVPTDCLALFLKNKMPNAIYLDLAFATDGGSISHGTAITMASKLGEGGAERKDGVITKLPIGKKGMWVNFGKKTFFVMSIPWGDISTAYFTTGIPNITTYTGVQPKVFRIMKFQFLFNWLLRTSFVRNFIKKKIAQRPAGPSDEMREKAKGYVWGRVINVNGESISAVLTGPEGYTITVHSTLLIAQKILENNYKVGYQTPAAVYGEDLIMEVPQMSREILPQKLEE